MEQQDGVAHDVTSLVRWTTSDGAVAGANRHGMVTGAADGQPKVTATLDTLEAVIDVLVTGGPSPRARLVQAAAPPEAGREPLSIVVEFVDTKEFDLSSLGVGDIRITGPDGFHQFPELAEHEVKDKVLRNLYADAVVDRVGCWCIRGRDEGLPDPCPRRPLRRRWQARIV